MSSSAVRFSAGETISDDPVKVMKGEDITIQLLEHDGFELTPEARERYNAPEEVPTYSVDQVRGVVKVA